MNAGFIKRAFSALVDITMVIAVVWVTFLIAGRAILQKQIPNFDEIYPAYQELYDSYNADLEAAQDEYTALKASANGNESLIAQADELYSSRVQTLNDQNMVDIDPYNRPLSDYYTYIIIYFIVGFLLLLSIYTVATKGKTLGRLFMKLKLEGYVNPVSIFLHDVILKYFFILFSFFINPVIAIILLAASLIADVILINFTKNKTTLRDMILRVTVAKADYWK